MKPVFDFEDDELIIVDIGNKRHEMSLIDACKLRNELDQVIKEVQGRQSINISNKFLPE